MNTASSPTRPCLLALTLALSLAVACGGEAVAPDADLLETSTPDAYADAQPEATDTQPEADGPGPDLQVDALADTAADAPADTSVDTPTDEAGPPPDPLAACADALIGGLPWAPAETESPWPGALQLAQTHVLDVPEARLAPPLIRGRAALALFTPQVPLEPGASAQIRALGPDGEPLGVLPLHSPDALPLPLEADLSDAPLAPYSSEAWSAPLPWSWLAEGVTLQLATVRDGVRLLHEHTLAELGAPHRFTVTRSKVVLFGEAPPDTRTQPAARIARDFFAALPFAELVWVDASDWHLDAIVVATDLGPRLVSSEAERIALVPADTDHWSILKNQFALRMSLANTGRGLVLTAPGEGDSSPYSFGTSVAMGWFLGVDGLFHDIDDAPWAAGWTGWTAMWAGECGNAFIHEVGHSMTLAHFTEGSAASWGIADEYPADGTQLATHPWGYDTTRQRLRTWYRVDAQGPVAAEADGALVGKRDPMNGGESANAATCFPQFTAWHARKAQAWAQEAPTLATHAGAVGVYRWDPVAGAYAPEEAAPSHQAPLATDAPVVTLIGTLTAEDGTSRIYPPIHVPSANIFELPDPLDPALATAFEGARWFVEVSWADGSTERALIARGVVEAGAMAHFALNLDADREPQSVALYRADAPWPDLDPQAATLVHTREIDSAPETPARVLRLGRGALAGGALRLRQRCEPGLNCAARRAESTWRRADGPLTFHPGPADEAPETSVCATPGDHTAWTLPIVSSTGASATLTVHGQRALRAGAHEVAVPMDDATPWLDAPDLAQSLRLWLPWAENAELPAGTWRLDGPQPLTASLGGVATDTVWLEVELEVLGTTPVDLAAPFVSAPVSTSPESSMYFLLRDPTIGPTERVWWDDGVDGPTLLRVPVVQAETGAVATLHLAAQNEECGGSRYDLNAGRGANACEHRAVLWVAAEGNEALAPGTTWQTPPSAPLVLEARRWHAPHAERLEATLGFELSWTVP